MPTNVDQVDALRWKKLSVLDDGFVCLVDAMGDDQAVVQAAHDWFLTEHPAGNGSSVPSPSDQASETLRPPPRTYTRASQRDPLTHRFATARRYRKATRPDRTRRRVWRSALRREVPSRSEVWISRVVV